MQEQSCQGMLHPVILTVPDTIQSWMGRRRVRALSRLARAAARQSARRAGGRLGNLRKSEEGVPLPSSGWYWSVAHKTVFVAGVAGPGPLGIDIEPVHPRSSKLFRKIADQGEWRLGNEDEWHLFYRFWTAKEAVLKAAGVGLKGLSHCRVIAIENPSRLSLAYKGRVWPVEQQLRHGHLAAVTSEKLPVCWVWPEDARRPKAQG
ncbi:MAG: 4'-phosphopantetheinyl transferase superfamily protein [Desulfobacterales bacterium]